MRERSVFIPVARDTGGGGEIQGNFVATVRANGLFVLNLGGFGTRACEPHEFIRILKVFNAESRTLPQARLLYCGSVIKNS